MTESRKATTEQWQYHLEVMKNSEITDMANRFNQLGAQGWEMVTSTSTIKTKINITGNDLVFVFKRRGVGKFVEYPDY